MLLTALSLKGVTATLRANECAPLSYKRLARLVQRRNCVRCLYQNVWLACWDGPDLRDEGSEGGLVTSCGHPFHPRPDLGLRVLTLLSVADPTRPRGLGLATCRLPKGSACIHQSQQSTPRLPRQTTQRVESRSHISINLAW